MAKSESKTRMGFMAHAVSLALSAAAVIAGAAYFFWLTPGHGPAPVEPAKAASKPGGKGEGRTRAQAAPVTAATGVEADMPVILSAPGTVEPLATVAVRPSVDGEVGEVAWRDEHLGT